MTAISNSVAPRELGMARSRVPGTQFPSKRADPVYRLRLAGIALGPSSGPLPRRGMVVEGCCGRRSCLLRRPQPRFRRSRGQRVCRPADAAQGGVGAPSLPNSRSAACCRASLSTDIDLRRTSLANVAAPDIRSRRLHPASTTEDAARGPSVSRHLGGQALCGAPSRGNPSLWGGPPWAAPLPTRTRRAGKNVWRLGCSP